MPDLYPGFSFSIETDDFFDPRTHAFTDIPKGIVFIRDSVYDAACQDEVLSRFTIAHELGHFMLMRVFGKSIRLRPNGRILEAYEDPEWQASAFAGELLIPAPLILHDSVSQIMEACKVSFAAAQTQHKACRSLRKESGTPNQALSQPGFIQHHRRMSKLNKH